MSNYTQAEARKEVNRIAKCMGLIIRQEPSQNNTAYYYVQQRSGDKRILAHGMTFWNMYESFMCNSYEDDCREGNTCDYKESNNE